MLSPDTRQTLLDALRPPAGFRLGCAVGTTYSLNLDAALTAPAAFALHAVSEEREDGGVEPLALLDSLRRHVDRFTVFFQAGQVAVPKQRRLFAYLEGAMVPVAAPRGGVFHPKLWVLRFDADEAPPGFRALCASRNLTHDRSWDTLLRLDSVQGPGSAQRSIEPAGLAHMVRTLPSIAVGGLSERRRTDIADLADQLETVRWSAPPGVRAGRFVPLGLDDAQPLPFPPTADRVAVVSPFVAAGLLNRLPSSTGRRVLVSRPEEIASYAKTVATRFDEVFTIDPDAVVSGIGDDTPEGSSPKVTSGDPTVPFDGLHAKLFVFDQGTTTTVLTGSANATSAAFGSNVEFLTELTGPSSAMGVECLLAEPTKDQPTLRTFLVPFPLDDAAKHLDEGDPLEDALDVLRRHIATLPFEARAVSDGTEDRFLLTLMSEGDPPTFPEGVTWRCWPITIAPDGANLVNPSAPVNETFTVSFEGITGFFANELTLGDVSTKFVLTADLVEAPANRATRLLRLLLGDAERFLRYLLLLLADDALDRFGSGDLFEVIDPSDEAAGSWKVAADSLPLLEALLRTLSRDPERLDHIHRLIVDLQKDPEGESLLPPGLMGVWEPIWAAACEGKR